MDIPNIWAYGDWAGVIAFFIANPWILWPWWLIIALTIATRIKIKLRRKRQERRYKEERENAQSSTPSNTDFRFTKRNLLKRSEIDFYRQLLPIANEKKLRVFANVRLIDVIEPERNLMPNIKARATNHIIRKHLDFVLCNSNFEPILAIELDGKSHDNPNQQKRDFDKDNALNNAGLKIIRVQSANGLRQQINNII